MTANAALNDFERFLERVEFSGNYFVAAEPHFARDVWHLHGLLANDGRSLNDYAAAWRGDRGVVVRFEDPRTDAAPWYCSKYAVKDAAGDTFRFRLERWTRRDRRLRKRLLDRPTSGPG